MPRPERELIKALRKLALRSHVPNVVKGIGDDTAVLRLKQGHELLVTTDLCVEGFHFRREWHPADVVGHRCLTRGLSDIAAMGGVPLACFLSLGLPADIDQKWVTSFVKGLTNLARQHGIELAGGDTSGAPAVTADIIVTGQLPAGSSILRSGARPDDRIYVTGELGESAATLQRLFAGEKIRPRRESRHFYPEARIAVGQWLRRKALATSMIDVSDGLSVDLSHICDESGVDAVIDARQIPVAPQASLDLGLNGGEDYELLFTAGPRSKVPKTLAGVRVTEIGTVQKQSKSRPQMRMMGHNGALKILKPKGWQHFNGGQKTQRPDA
jgi:thiamine-monophosphate kinase